MKLTRDPKAPLTRLLAGLTLLLAACSESPPGTPNPGGGAGTGGTTQANGGSAGGGAPAGGAGSGGSAGSAVGGSPFSGGTGGTSGASNTGGAGAGSGGAGPAGSAGSSGVSGTGGAADGGSPNGGASGSGTAGVSGAGTSGAGGAGSGGGGAGGASGSGGASAGTSGQAGASGSAGTAGAGGTGYQPCPATGPCKIMPFGDSITEGYPVSGGYRSELFRLEHMAGNDITFVGSANNNGPTMVDGVTFPRNHEGHGGFTISGGNGIAQFVSGISSYQPHIVILKIGTNDINGNNDVANAPARLGTLLDSIFSADPDLLVILVQIVPTRTSGTNQAIQTYNAAMPALVTARQNMGRHIFLVDMYTEFTSTPNYQNALLGDNLHPNQAGYTRMAEVFFDALSPYLP